MEYEYDINQSLVRYKTLAGIEYIPLSVVGLCFGFTVFMASQSAWKVSAVMAAVTALSYAVAYSLNKKDPQFFAVYLRASRYKNFYAPRPSVLKRYAAVDGKLKQQIASAFGIVLLAVSSMLVLALVFYL